jgi:hypothetical protein
MEQVARLPTRKELWRAALMVMVGDAAITIVSALAFRSRRGHVETYRQKPSLEKGAQRTRAPSCTAGGCASLEGRS